MTKWIQLTIVVGLAGLLASCTKVNSGMVGMFNFDTDLRVVFNVANDINPDENHTPSPLFIRLYELSSDKAFKQADFLSLYERDEALLGKDLLARQELARILPGTNREERFVVNSETRYVALFAEFFQFKNAKYSLVFPVTSHNVIENTVRIDITDNKIMLHSGR